MKKYELVLDQTKVLNETTLYRIKALRNFGDVKAEDLGGWIEKEDNLSHEGSCWVYDNAKVYGNARIVGDAQIFGNVQISGDARVFGNAYVRENAYY